MFCAEATGHQYMPSLQSTVSVLSSGAEALGHRQLHTARTPTTALKKLPFALEQSLGKASCSSLVLTRDVKWCELPPAGGCNGELGTPDNLEAGYAGRESDALPAAQPSHYQASVWCVLSVLRQIQLAFCRSHVLTV